MKFECEGCKDCDQSVLHTWKKGEGACTVIAGNDNSK